MSHDRKGDPRGDREGIRKRALRATAAVTGRRRLIRAAAAAAVSTAVMFGGAIEDRVTMQPVPAYAQAMQDGVLTTAPERLKVQGKSCFMWGPPAPPAFGPEVV